MNSILKYILLYCVIISICIVLIKNAWMCMLFKINIFGGATYSHSCNIIFMASSALLFWMVLKCPVSSLIKIDDKDNNFCPNLFTKNEDTKAKTKDENIRTKFIIGSLTFLALTVIIFLNRVRIMNILYELHPITIVSNISIIVLLYIYFDVMVGLKLPK